MSSENAEPQNTGDPEFVDELAPGTTLLQGQYTIERFLNAGGFGITYLARNSLDRKVVIKECFPGSFCRRSRYIVQARSRAHQRELESIVKLFVQEARSLAKVEHPNIVGVHQVFEDNNTAYMALDFVEGRDLLDMIEDPDWTMEPAKIKEMLRRTLEAVAFIHKEGMLHRDISPDNILVERDGNPILIDFGAAREQASKKTRVLSAMRVVKDGYSPQEFYISGSQQGPHSDLYALGASFYHVIGGEIPPNSQERLSAAATGEPDPYRPLAGRVSGFDEGFLRSVDKAMAVLPKERMQSAEEWLFAIEGRGCKPAAEPSEAAMAASATLTDYAKPDPAPVAPVAPVKRGKGALIAVLMGSVAAAGIAVIFGLPLLNEDSAEVPVLSDVTDSVAAPDLFEPDPARVGEGASGPRAAEPLRQAALPVPAPGAVQTSGAPDMRQTDTADTDVPMPMIPGTAAAAATAADTQTPPRTEAAAPLGTSGGTPTPGTLPDSAVELATEIAPEADPVVSSGTGPDVAPASAPDVAPRAVATSPAASAPDPATDQRPDLPQPTDKTAQRLVPELPSSPNPEAMPVLAAIVMETHSVSEAGRTFGQAVSQAVAAPVIALPQARTSARPGTMPAGEIELVAPLPGGAAAALSAGIAVPVAAGIVSAPDWSLLSTAAQAVARVARIDPAPTAPEGAPMSGADASQVLAMVRAAPLIEGTGTGRRIASSPAEQRHGAAGEAAVRSPLSIARSQSAASAAVPRAPVPFETTVALRDMAPSLALAPTGEFDPSDFNTGNFGTGAFTVDPGAVAPGAAQPGAVIAGAPDSLPWGGGAASTQSQQVAVRLPWLEQAPATGSPSQVTSSWTVELPFEADPTAPDAIGTVAAEGTAAWIRPGTRVRSVNGAAVDSIADIPAVLWDSVALDDQMALPLTFGVVDAASGAETEAMLFLPVVQNTVLTNGLAFRTQFASGAWQSRVVAVPATMAKGGPGNLQPGDVLVSYLSDNRKISGRTTLADLLRREFDAGVTHFNFMVQRDGETWIASMNQSVPPSN